MSLKENLALFLENMPAGIAEGERQELSGFAVKDELVEGDKNQIIVLCKKAYPQIFAYLKIFNSCCRKKEELGIHKSIKDESVRARFDKFIGDGGDIEKLKQGKVDEEYLSGEDLEIFKKAERKMHEEVAEETRAEISGSRKAEFDDYAKTGEEAVKKIDKKIAALRRLAQDSPEWSAEIFGKIAELEDRWANFGNEPQETDVNELLDYFGSVVNIEGGE